MYLKQPVYKYLIQVIFLGTFKFDNKLFHSNIKFNR